MESQIDFVANLALQLGQKLCIDFVIGGDRANNKSFSSHLAQRNGLLDQ